MKKESFKYWRKAWSERNGRTYNSTQSTSVKQSVLGIIIRDNAVKTKETSMTEITPNTAKSKKIRPKQIEVMEQFWAYTLNTKH